MIYFILLICLALRLVLLNESFDLAETNLLLNPSGLPIYPLFQKILSLTGARDEWFLRFPNLFFAVLSVYSLYRLVELLNPKTNLRIMGSLIPVSLIAAVFLALNPLHVYYSSQLGNYSLSVLLAILSWYSLVSFTKNENKENFLTSYFIVSLLSLYTFHGAIFNLAAQIFYLYLYHQKVLKQNGLSFGFLFLLLIPIIYFLDLKNLPQSTLMVSLKSFFLIPAKLSLGRINFSSSPSLFISSGLVTIYFLSLLALSLRHKTSRPFAIWLGLPLVLSLFVSFVFNALDYWHFLFLLPAFVTLISMGINQLPNFLAVINLSVITLILITTNLFFFITPAFHKEDWRQTLGYLSSKQTEQSLVVFTTKDLSSPIYWYTPNLNAHFPLTDLNDDPALLDSRLSSATVGKTDIFYLSYLEPAVDPNKNIVTWLTNAGYTPLETLNFRGTGDLIHYRVNDLY